MKTNPAPNPNGAVGPVFHGTEADFQTFRDGITWFTPKREETFHQYRADETKPWFIFEANLLLRNPADLNDLRVQNLLEAHGFEPDQIGLLTEQSRLVVPLLEKAGFDGMTALMAETRHHAVFHPTQILVLRREILPPTPKPPFHL